MTGPAARKLKPTGGIKVDHASVNRELRDELSVKACRSTPSEKDQKTMDETDLGDVLGEIEDLVEQEVAAAGGDVDAELEEALDQAFDQALEPAPDGVVAPAGDDEAEDGQGGASIAADAAAQADGAEVADADAIADVLGEVVAAVEAAAGATEATQEAAIDGNVDEITTDAPAANADDGADGQDAEDAPSAEAQALAEAGADGVEPEAEAPSATAPGPATVKTAAAKPGITVPKVTAVVGRKGLLPPVRKTVTVAPASAAKPAETPAPTASTVKPAAGVGVKVVPAAKPGPAAPAPKTAAIGKPAAPGAKPVAAAKPNVASKPAVAVPKPAAAVKPAAAAAKPAAAPAAAGPSKPVGAKAAAPAAKPAVGAAAKPKVAAVPKVIQARVVPDDGDEDADEAAGGDETKTAPAPKGGKKTAKAGAEAGEVGGKRPASEAATAAKKRVVTVGAKASAAYELYKAEHKQELVDGGMEAALAAEQTVKDWAALSAEEKAEYEERAKEQAGEEAAPEPALRKAQQQPKTARTKAAPAEAGPKYYTNGYLLFLEERRPEIVAANPAASFTDVGKLLGGEWRGLGKEEQEEFNRRAKALNVESGAQPKPRKSKKKDEAAAGEGAADGKKAAGAKRAPAAKTASKKGKKAVAAGADGEDNDALLDLAVAAADGMEIDGDGDDGPGADGAAAGARRGKASAGSRKRGGGGGGSKKRGRSGAACKTEEDAEGADGAAAEDSGDESDREDVDWEGHPAEAILAQTTDGRYLVKRVGLGLDEYGIVNARAVKRQRLTLAGAAAEPGEDEEAPPPLPVSIEMVDEFEQFQRTFWASVQDRSDGGDLDLDDLGEQSPLEMCYFLGKLRENRMPLNATSVARRDKDTMIRVPALRLSMSCQRVIMLERQRADDLAARLAEAEAKLAQYEGVEGADAEEQEAAA